MTCLAVILYSAGQIERCEWNSQERDWAGSGDPWNPPTSYKLQPMSDYIFGFRLLMAPSIRERDSGLVKAGKAAVQGVPGVQFICWSLAFTVEALQMIHCLGCLLW